jgi:hypothetical protein
MKKLLLPAGTLGLYAIVLCSSVQAAALLSPTDFIIAIDTDPAQARTKYSTETLSQST